MVDSTSALPGRDREIFTVPTSHAVLGSPLHPEDADLERIYLAMGCFWGAEELYWQLPGVAATSVGYMGGFTAHPTYEEVCTGLTGHTETVFVAYRPAEVSTFDILKVFWENHDPTQGMRQGNDIGSQYRSAVYTTSAEQAEAAVESARVYQTQLSAAGLSTITTEIAPLGDFFYAEPYHQQYLGKNPNGYCGIGGTGVSCPIGTGVSQA